MQIAEHTERPRYSGRRQVSLLLRHLTIGDVREKGVEQLDSLLKVGSLRLENLQRGRHVDAMFAVGHRRDEPACLAWPEAEFSRDSRRPLLGDAIGSVAIEADQRRREASQHLRAEFLEMRDAWRNAADPVGPDFLAQSRLEGVTDMIVMDIETGQQNPVAGQAEQLGLPPTAAWSFPVRPHRRPVLIKIQPVDAEPGKRALGRGATGAITFDEMAIEIGIAERGKIWNQEGDLTPAWPRAGLVAPHPLLPLSRLVRGRREKATMASMPRRCPRSESRNSAGAPQDAGRCRRQAHLTTRKAFLRHLSPIRKKRWVVYAKPPFAGPQAVLAYLSRYTHRVAISNRRLLGFDETGVTFRYKDYRRPAAERQQIMTLATDEFIRRFLIHVLPRGFHRIRHHRHRQSRRMRHDPAWLSLHDGRAHGVLADGPAHAHLGIEPGAGRTGLQNHHRPHSDAAQSHVDPTRTDTSGPAALTHQNYPKAALPIDQRVGPAGSSTGGFRTQAPETLHRSSRLLSEL